MGAGSETQKRRCIGALALTVCALAAGLGGASSHAASSGPAAPDGKLQVTFVGDSISASFEYVTSAKRALGKGWNVRYDLKVCRRLVASSCAFQGAAPPTAYQAVTALGGSVGDVLIVNVGYNEGSYGYRDGMRRLLRSAFAQGARGVVWVTLRETNPVYTPTNSAIRKEAARWQHVEVADWDTYSRGRAWFREDGLHLNTAGAHGLAKLLRAAVQRVA